MYFTSDLHLGHEKVADMRGFKSVEAHDETIANNWMEAVGKNDVVYILGDISCCSRRSEIAALDLIEALPGTKRLIAGNHDSVWAGNRHAWRNMRMFHEVFEGVAPFARLRWNREPVLLSHFPMMVTTPERTGIESLGLRIMVCHCFMAIPTVATSSLSLGLVPYRFMWG